MKSKVLNRPMFNKGGAVETVPEDMVENVGIMQGFMEPEDDDYEDEGYQTEAMDERKPNSPEILMNNIRGDMRSMDARVDELANLVGEEAAMGTPTEVLALLQPMLAGQGGISGLPVEGMQPPMAPPMIPPMPPGGMPPPPGAEGGIGALLAPPTDQGPPPMAPINMAKGGYVQVQRFQAGSDEEGVTPGSYSPDMLKYAQEQLAASRGASGLESEVNDILPMYQKILGGGDRNTMQGQALMDIAQAGLRLASGRNAQGVNVAGDSFAGQLASAGMGLPEKLAARAGQFQQEERAVKLAALKAAESNVEGQRKLFGQIIKSAGASPFGKGDWDFAVLNRPGLLQKWSENQTTPEEDNLIESAITKMQAPRMEFKTDPVTKQVYQVQVPGALPSFVSAARAKRGGAGPSAQTTGTGSYAVAPPESPLVRDTNGNVIDIRATEDPNAPPAIDRTLGIVPPSAGEIQASTTPAVTSAYSKTDPTFFNMAGKGTGPINVTKPFLAKIPGLGDFINADKEIEATTFLKTGINRITAALGETERFGSIEKAQILGQLDLLPSLIDRKEAYQQRVVGLDTMLLKASDELASTAYNTQLTPSTQGDARAKLDQIRQVRAFLGAPPRVFTTQDFNALEIGTPFILPNGKIQFKSAEITKR
jgi:hypothetical protein